MSEFVDYLDENFGIRTVAGGKQVQLTSGPCPFCGEDRRDLRVYYDPRCEDIRARRGFCHHCDAGFSAVEFVAAFEQCSIREAIAILGGNEDGFKRSQEAQDGSEESKMIYPPLLEVEAVPEALEYCESRGITREIIRQQGIYFAEQNTLRPDGRIMWSANRLIFVIYDRAGQPVAWQGRDITGLARQKYLFPDGFKKAEYLYNIHRIKNRPEYLILAEGVMDSIGWIRAELDSVVSTFGKTISGEQRRILAEVAPKRLYVAWDSDAHWSKYELVESVRHLYEDIRIIDLHDQDADELTREQLNTALHDAKPYSWEDKVLGQLA